MRAKAALLMVGGRALEESPMSVVPMKFRDQEDPRRHSLWITPCRLAELNDFALLSATLRCANRETVARALLARFRGLPGVFGADEFALRSVEGMGRDDVHRCDDRPGGGPPHRSWRGRPAIRRQQLDRADRLRPRGHGA